MPEFYPLAGKRVFVAGHRGMVGAALLRRLAHEACEVVVADRTALDLTQQANVEAFFAAQHPEVVILAAAKVGGILANDRYPADFLLQNLLIETNVMAAAQRHKVEKFLLLGSSCIYPKFAPQPIPEEALLTGPLEATNEWYAIAKIAGIKLGQAFRRQHGSDFIAAMPTNLYGPGDNFDLSSSHVVPALLRKAHAAKLSGAPNFVIWGSGTPRREFLHVDDCADALVFLLTHYSDEAHINVGSGSDITIFELAQLIARVVGFAGEIVRDPSKPDGTPRKLMSADRLAALGWRPRISLEAGLAATYRWFLSAERARGLHDLAV
jgi:GDP-L-fucose synthase